MLSILLEGTLTAEPVQRTSAKGQPFTTARMRAAGEDGEAVWCSVIAFNADAAADLAALANGDALAIAGFASLTTWERDGATRVGLKVTASRVMSVYQAGQRRKAANQRNEQEG